MQNKILQKLIKVLFTTFIAVFLFGGGLVSQKAYAAEPDPKAASTQSAKAACDTAGGSLNPDNSCFIAGAKDCSKLTGYEEKSPADNTGIVCQKSVTASAANAEQEKVLKERIYFILALQKWLNAIIWPVLVMIGDLMNNNILFGAGMDERLREIWIPVRNLINLFFVLAMVGIAIYNILGVGDDNDTYSIKQILPKMIIAIIAVNFSFLGIKVFLDGINVLTTSIFALPDQVNDGLGNVATDEETIKRFCLGTMGRTLEELGPTNNAEIGSDLVTYKVIASKFVDEGDIDAVTKSTSKAEVDKLISALYTTNQDNFKKAVKEDATNRVCTNDGKLTPRGQAFLKTYSSQNAALAMALNMSKMVFYPEIDITTLTEANISKLFTNTIFSAAMYLIYVVSFLALFVVLMARLVVMWLGVVASPIIIVSMILPVFKEKLGFGDLVDKFVQNAIAPIMIAFSMTIGWIMLRAIQTVNILSSESVKIVNGIPVAGLNTMQDLIVALGTIGVIWMAVSFAANKSIAEPVTKALYGGLGKVGSFVGDVAWKHTPLFPVSIPGKDEKIMMTPGILGDVIDRAERKFKTNQEDKAQMVAEAIGVGTPGEKPLSALNNAQTSREALGIMKNNEYKIRNGGKEVDKELTNFLNDSNGLQFKKDIALKKSGEELHRLITAYEKETKDADKKTIRGQIADHLKYEGSKLDTQLEAGEAGTTPKAGTAPAPYAFTANSKVGGADLGPIDATKQAALIKAQTDLTKALTDKKDEAGLKPLIKQFATIAGQKPFAAELRTFITDPDAQAQLKKLFPETPAGDAKLKNTIDTASAGQVPGAAIPKGAVPEQAGKQASESERTASVAPLPQAPTRPINPLEAPLVGQPGPRGSEQQSAQVKPPQPNPNEPKNPNPPSEPRAEV